MDLWTIKADVRTVAAAEAATIKGEETRRQAPEDQCGTVLMQ